MWPSCCTAFRAKARVAASALGQQGLSLLRQGAETQESACDNQIMVCRELLIATSTFFTCGLLHQTETHYSAAMDTRARVEIRSLLAEAPQVVPARRRISEPLEATFPATS